jgi:uncharacterized membrane protein
MADVKDLTSKAIEKAGQAAPANAGEMMSKPAGLAVAGAAVAALPIVAEQVAKRLGPKGAELVDQAKDAAGQQVGEKVKEKAKEAAPEAVKSLPGGGILSKFMGGGGDGEESGGLFSKLTGGDSDSDSDGGGGRAAPGHGSGRRMPIQQSVDVGVPLKTVYNHWTQFEDWPDYMHRVESVDQVDDCTVAIQTKAWAVKRRFEAEIIEQRPDERIEWNVTQGIAHTGVVTFHKLSDRLTRIEISLDIEPSGFFEKVGRGWRFAKRAVRGDLHRFKAHVELNEDEPVKGWRGTIKDGKVVRRTERKASRSSGRSRGSSNGSSGSRSRSRSSSNGSSGSSRSRSKSGSKS